MKICLTVILMAAGVIAQADNALTNDIAHVFERVGKWYHADMVDSQFKVLAAKPGMTKDRMSSLLIEQAMARVDSTNQVEQCARSRIIAALANYGNANAIPFLENVLAHGNEQDQFSAFSAYLKLIGTNGCDVAFFASMPDFMTRMDSETRRALYLTWTDRLRTGQVSETNRVVLTAFLLGNVNHEEVGAGALDEALCLCDSTYATNAVRRSRLIRLIPSGRVCPLDLPRLRQELERLNTPQNP